jgi:glycerol kinase
MIVDRRGTVIASAQKEHRQIYPQPGWVEHDPQEIWLRVQEVVAEALEKGGLKAQELAAVGVTNQRETTVVWDRHTGAPISNAIVWQDTRTTEICKSLAAIGGQDQLRRKTGLPLATYFSGPKLRWMLDHLPDAAARAKAGDLLFGTIDSWLIWNLTGGSRGGIHVTDVTNASRTLLMNLETLDWDPEILRLLEIPRAMLPAIASSSEIYGAARGELDLFCSW